MEKEAKRGQSGGGGLQITQKYGTGGPTNIQGRQEIRGTGITQNKFIGNLQCQIEYQFT